MPAPQGAHNTGQSGTLYSSSPISAVTGLVIAIFSLPSSCCPSPYKTTQSGSAHAIL